MPGTGKEERMGKEGDNNSGEKKTQGKEVPHSSAREI